MPRSKQMAEFSHNTTYPGTCTTIRVSTTEGLNFQSILFIIFRQINKLYFKFLIFLSYYVIIYLFDEIQELR